MIKQEMKTLPAPIAHMNGTGGQALQKEIREAADAVAMAQKALRNMTVHSRDFYVRPDFKEAFEAYYAAAADRALALENMYNELVGIYNAISYGRSEAEFDKETYTED